MIVDSIKKIFGQIKLKSLATLIPVIIFSILLFVEINRSLENISVPLFKAGNLGLLAAERRQALEWLSRHSPRNSVIIADQFDGNYIVLFARRPVVSSSKVYPSEANEVSRRYIDIAKFFFATDELEALKIAEKYNANYVFVGTGFSYSKNCKLANSCHFISSGELTPVGKKMTLIGRFLGRERFENFELVWDSPSFSIYRILNKKTERNPCHLNDSEKYIALSVIRGAPDSFGRECSVALSAYRDGKRFGPVFVSKIPLGQALRQAAEKIFDEFGKDVRVQVAIWSEEELVERDIQKFLESTFDLTKVLIMEHQGRRAIFLPEEFNLREIRSNEEVLEMLCSILDKESGCWRNKTKIFVAPVMIFAEDAKAGIIKISGTLPIPSEVEKFDEKVFRNRLILARNWIWSMRTQEGNFRNEINPHNPKLTPENTRLATLHGAAETWWLLEFHRAFEDLPDIIPFAKKQSDRFENLIYSGQQQRTAFLIYAGLENLSLWRITKDRLYLDRALHYANILRHLFIDNANLASSFIIKDGAPQIVSSKSAGTIANNSGLYFMAEVLVEKEDPRLRESILKFSEALKSNFRKNRILDPGISIVWESWLVNAFSSVAKVTENREDAEFALEVANWILDHQSYDEYLHLRGAFRALAATSGVGKITEALVDAANLAKRIGEDPKPYFNGFYEAMRWLMSVQYSNDSYFLSDINKQEMLGALRSGPTDITAEIDNAGHMVIAGAWYYLFNNQ